ncbi:hypothetical protein A0128_04890 [Leptospira tipperaryensis]|uniref:Uncharacterized protein n=1 Tax=Leptospira tipperaryensis TaxID=2564040 RepID=A0A1D7UUM6_9LEPT|nr:hypothetical protein A0128_04890 [Leptospira tipperaryensis]
MWELLFSQKGLPSFCKKNASSKFYQKRTSSPIESLFSVESICLEKQMQLFEYKEKKINFDDSYFYTFFKR